MLCQKLWPAYGVLLTSNDSQNLSACDKATAAVAVHGCWQSHVQTRTPPALRPALFKVLATNNVS
jgi:hypothetical protein